MQYQNLDDYNFEKIIFQTMILGKFGNDDSRLS